MSHLTFAQAIVAGFIQGVTELFPISSLGHNVLIPALIGGSWAKNLNVTAPAYLAFIIGLHVATALAMIIYFWRDWVRIVGGFFTSLRDRQVTTTAQRMAWMIILGTIPVGIVGLLVQHAFQVVFSKAIIAAYLLMANGLILYAGEKWRPQASKRADQQQARERQLASQPEARERQLAGRPEAWDPPAGRPEAWEPPAGQPGPGTEPPGYAAEPPGSGGEPPEPRMAGRHASGHQAVRQQEFSEGLQADARLSRLGYGQALGIGSLQILALLAGISRDGIVMVGGMFRGLSRQDAARFSFLLSAPVILAAGVLKLPDLMGSAGDGIRPQILVGSLAAAVSAYLSLRFLVRYLQTRTLTPFAVYCLLFGLASAIYLAVK